MGGPVYESWEGLKWLIHVYKVRSVPWTLPCALWGTVLTRRRTRPRQKLFCDPRSGLPRVLRFKTRVEYELRKVLATAIASIRDADGVTPLEVLEFCVDALQGHDNSGNAFDDGPMVAGTFMAAHACVWLAVWGDRRPCVCGVQSWCVALVAPCTIRTWSVPSLQTAMRRTMTKRRKPTTTTLPRATTMTTMTTASQRTCLPTWATTTTTMATTTTVTPPRRTPSSRLLSWTPSRGSDLTTTMTTTMMTSWVTDPPRPRTL